MARFKRLPIDEIVVYERHRKDLGDIEALAADIEANGLIHPVTINHDNELLAGERRLAAANHLGWDKIDCAILSPDDDLDIEWSENEMRKNFTITERGEINRDKKAKLSQQGKRTDLNEGDDTCVNVDTSEPKHKSRDIAAKMSGLGGQATATKVENVIDNGSVAVQEAVNGEELSINLASQLVHAVPSKTEQTALVKEGKAAVKKAVGNLAKGKKATAKTPSDYPLSQTVAQWLDLIIGQAMDIKVTHGGFAAMMKSPKWQKGMNEHIEAEFKKALRKLTQLEKEFRDVIDHDEG